MKNYYPDKRTLLMMKIKNITRIVLLVIIMLQGEYCFSQGKIYKNSRPQIRFQTTGTENGHDYVDLGLPSGNMWATCNIGANHPTDFGEYYAWGELVEKKNYTIDNCSTIGDLPLNINNTQYDVANNKWSGKWRLPTKDDFQELVDLCSWKWSIINGVAGYKIIGPNKNSIFLPAGDSKDENGSKGQFVNVSGDYWSANSYKKGTSIYENNSNPIWLNCSYGLFFFNKGKDVRSYPRYFGRNVRPVF